MKQNLAISIPKSLTNFAKVCLETLSKSTLGRFITLDSFDDLVASKMTALIERGAPRDFLDIYEICNKDLVTISRCWALWRERELKRGITETDQQIGCEAILLHLSRIEKSRPLDTITDSNQRYQAEKVRVWFKNEFCKSKIYTH